MAVEGRSDFLDNTLRIRDGVDCVPDKPLITPDQRIIKIVVFSYCRCCHQVSRKFRWSTIHSRTPHLKFDSRASIAPAGAGTIGNNLRKTNRERLPDNTVHVTQPFQSSIMHNRIIRWQCPGRDGSDWCLRAELNLLLLLTGKSTVDALRGGT
jgi:hypothetical protein